MLTNSRRRATSLRWAGFTVQVDDIIYTARGQRMRRRTGDPGHYAECSPSGKQSRECRRPDEAFSTPPRYQQNTLMSREPHIQECQCV